MNIKQFYLIKALEDLPTDIIKKIWKNLMEYSASVIANIYRLKVSKNMDIFLYLGELIFKTSSHVRMKKLIRYMEHNITYDFIQCYPLWLKLLKLCSLKYGCYIEGLSEIIFNIKVTEAFYNYESLII